MISVENKSVNSNAQNEELMEPVQIYQIYPEQFVSGVPRYFVSRGPGNGYYKYPEDDEELLRWCKRPLRWNGADRFHGPEIYEVKVKAENCIVEECLELLKEIGRENRFIACSVESACLFFAELNKEDADKLKGLGGICYVFPRTGQLVQH